MKFTCESTEQTLQFAEDLGWVQTDDQTIPDHAYGDWLENKALDFIESKGYTIEI